jgi:catechol 2,3-dioxygenase-like lactoylglutathione lyase family enzyme
MGVRSLHHIAIRVRDPEASRRFYEDVLGFRFMEIPVSGAMITEWEDAPAEGKQHRAGWSVGQPTLKPRASDSDPVRVAWETVGVLLPLPDDSSSS